MDLAEVVGRSGLSLEQISERSGLDQGRLQSLLEGSDPTVVELRDLAAALGLVTSDLLLDSETEQRTTLLFRQSIQSRPKPQTIKAPIESFSRKVGQSLEVLTEPNLIPPWITALRPTVQSQETAEISARSFRQLFYENNQVGPILSLPQIAVEKLGILLFLVDNPGFEGASALVGNHPFVFISQRSFPPRMLFTLGHELGHLIAHHNSADFAVLDIPNDVDQLRPRARTEEAFADAFSSSLLLPAEGVGIALQKIRQLLKIEHDAIGDIELLYLARIFGVSFQTAARRCEILQLLPSGGGQSLYENMVKHHRNPERYADELGLPERPEVEFPVLPPRLVNDAIEGIRSGRISVGRASSILNLSIGDILRLHAGGWQHS